MYVQDRMCVEIRGRRHAWAIEPRSLEAGPLSPFSTSEWEHFLDDLLFEFPLESVFVCTGELKISLKCLIRSQQHQTVQS
jgi:hypothetical protein